MFYSLSAFDINKNLGILNFYGLEGCKHVVQQIILQNEVLVDPTLHDLGKNKLWQIFDAGAYGHPSQNEAQHG